jgi:hypothetical protein
LLLGHGGLSRRAGAIGLDHYQTGFLEDLFCLDLRLFMARFLVPGLFMPWFFVPRLFVARLRVHRLGVLRFAVLRFLLALRLELVNPALGFDHGGIDMRGGLLAPPVAVAIAAASAAPAAPLLVAVALRTRMLGTRIASVRARVLDRGLSLALG